MDYTAFGSGRLYCDMPDWVNQYEDCFQSDCSRLVYSPSFRRLQGKTQLYPNGEYDYFRSRLTHSLEVNEIAQCIGTRINQQIKNLNLGDGFSVSADVLRFACLAHDLGHPPFGHDGEKQLDACMGDAGGFNGNSQTFRLLTRLEKGCINYAGGAEYNGERTGLNLTFRTLASTLKHIEEPTDKSRGFYASEKDIVDRVFSELGSPDKYLRTVECQIMDIADDISNAVHDLDDSLKSNLLNPFDLFFPEEDFKKIYFQLNIIFSESGFVNLTAPKGDDIVSVISPIYRKLRTLSSDGAKRTLFINNLKNKFISSLYIDYEKGAPLFSRIYFAQNNAESDNAKLQISILKSFHHYYQCKSSYIESRAYRGKHIVRRLYEAIIDDPRLMPDDYYHWFRSFEQLDDTTRIPLQKRCICDFISGMTDRYCLEFYGRLFSETPQSIFKPL